MNTITVKTIIEGNLVNSKLNFPVHVDNIDMFNALLFDAAIIVNSLTGAPISNFTESRICKKVSFDTNDIKALTDMLDVYYNNAIDLFNHTYSSHLERIRKSNIEGVDKITAEINRVSNIITEYIKFTSNCFMMQMITGFDFEVAGKLKMNTVNMKELIIAKVIELRNYLISLFTKSVTTPTQQTVSQPAPAPQSIPQQPNPMPMNMVSTPIGASPFIVPIQPPVPTIPEYLTNPDIARHFVIGNTLYIPDINEQYKFRDVLLSIVKSLDEKKDDSVFTLTRFYNPYDWTAEKINTASGMILNPNSADYKSITYYPDGRGAELTKNQSSK